jgi:hypothetical protein
MQWTGPNQKTVEWDTNTTNTNPGPLHTAVEGFSRYKEQVESLPFDEVIQLRVLTDFIVASFEPGNLPITGIHVIGHADTDLQRGKAFEQQISETRARNVQGYLKREVERNAKVNSRLVPGTPTATIINWKPRGVGATQPNPENVKRGKTALNMTEEDRKRNRRVEIVLEPGLNPVQEIPINLNLPAGYGSGAPGGLPPVPPSSQPQKQQEWLKNALQQDPIIRSLPPAIRDKVVDAAKDVDEAIADKVLDSLPMDPKIQGAVKATVKGLLQLLKGKKFTAPIPQPPQYQQPPSNIPPFPKAPGEVIIPGPVLKF